MNSVTMYGMLRPMDGISESGARNIGPMAYCKNGVS
jgi:hypothetical protein